MLPEVRSCCNSKLIRGEAFVRQATAPVRVLHSRNGPGMNILLATILLELLVVVLLVVVLATTTNVLDKSTLLVLVVVLVVLHEHTPCFNAYFPKPQP